MPWRRWGFAQILVIVCALGASVRLGYVLGFRLDTLPYGGDPYYYSAGASLLADGHGLLEPLTVFTGRPEQSASHPPLYQLWLAVASWLDPGRDPALVLDPALDTGPTVHVQTVHMLWTIVIGVGTVALCGLVGRRVAGSVCGVVAAAIAAVYPNIWIYDGMLEAETLAIFTIALVLWSAYAVWDRPTAGRAAALGLCCGLAALTRSELVLTVAFVLAPLVLLVRSVPLRRRLGLLAAGGLAALAAIGPWVGYNVSRFEAPVYLSTNGGGAAAAANCDSTYYGDLIGYKDYACGDAAYRAAAAGAPDWDELDPSQRDDRVRREVSAYVHDHLGRVPVVVAARVGRLLKVYGVGQELDWDDRVHNQERPLVLAGLVSWYGMAAAATAGVIVLRRRRAGPLLPLLAVPALVVVAVAVTFAQTRYRAPAEPALAVLAAVAADAAWQSWRHRRTPAADEATVGDGADREKSGESQPAGGGSEGAPVAHVE
jgi:4-amino-4-deoxy-L-arabinose transferase-like glycosyltransferase